MDTSSAKAASDTLVGHWQAGTVLDALPTSLRPADKQEGYLVQAQIERLSSQPLFGWKIAATSTDGQKHINVDGPIAGRLLAEKVLHDGDIVPLGANRMRVAEAEFAFRMSRDLPPRADRYDVTEVLAAVSELHLAIEIPDSRYSDFQKAGGPQLIADNACAHLFVLGPSAPSHWRDLDLVSHQVFAQVEGRLAREGTGANVLGDPRLALTWLANELSALKVTLKADQVVTTGTCIKPMEIRAGDTVSVDYGVLGRVSCRIGDR